MAFDGLRAGGTDIADFPEFITGIRIGDVDFHRGKSHCLQRVQNGDAGMGIGTGIDHNAVGFAVRLLDGIHQIPFMIGLVQGDINPQLSGMFLNETAKICIGGFAVDLRFTDAQHVKVWSVNNKNVHGSTCLNN